MTCGFLNFRLHYVGSSPFVFLFFLLFIFWVRLTLFMLSSLSKPAFSGLNFVYTVARMQKIMM